MTGIQAALLGLIQGLTEFLPISSSGHLVIGQKILGLTEPPILFDIFIHAGTLLAVLVFFRSKLLHFFTSWPNLKKLFIASLPAGILGLILENYLGIIFSQTVLVGLSLLITAAILFLTRFSKNKNKPIGLKQALLIGLFQALALLPGISRSGSTISAGLFQGINRTQSFEFSFFLAVPAILAALGLEIFKNGWQQVDLTTSLIGFLASFLLGYLSLVWLKKIISQTKFYLFSFYCFSLGIFVLIFSLV